MPPVKKAEPAPMGRVARGLEMLQVEQWAEEVARLRRQAGASLPIGDGVAFALLDAHMRLSKAYSAYRLTEQGEPAPVNTRQAVAEAVAVLLDVLVSEGADEAFPVHARVLAAAEDGTWGMRL